ncbi:protealysin inhibitor emfourin [Streptomyces sp. ISL-86]|uniref:protealysin inhibitor emfourin n=1 Tax=unclassified Streptomyces TaxID=2593676 RepID=UPI0035A86872
MTRSGGLPGIARRGELDTSGRPDAAELERLALDVVANTPTDAASGVPDGYQYVVTVDEDRTVEFTDPGLSDAQLQLVELVLGEGA